MKNSFRILQKSKKKSLKIGLIGVKKAEKVNYHVNNATYNLHTVF